MDKLIIYTDGSCLGNGRTENCGGYAFIILNEDEEIISKFSKQELNTTNNRMEMKAVITGITEAINCLNSNDFIIEVYTDSAYIHNCRTQRWYKSWKNNGWKNSKKEPVKNKDLWEILSFFFEDKRFIFNKVKGHAGNKFNELVDTMAVAASNGTQVNEVNCK